MTLKWIISTHPVPPYFEPGGGSKWQAKPFPQKLAGAQPTMIWPSGIFIACKSLNASISDINCPPPKPSWPSTSHNIYTPPHATAWSSKYAKYVCLMEASLLSASQKHYHLRAWPDWPVAFSAMYFPFRIILVRISQNKFCTPPTWVISRHESYTTRLNRTRKCFRAKKLALDDFCHLYVVCIHPSWFWARSSNDLVTWPAPGQLFKMSFVFDMWENLLRLQVMVQVRLKNYKPSNQFSSNFYVVVMLLIIVARLGSAKEKFWSRWNQFWVFLGAFFLCLELSTFRPDTSIFLQWNFLHAENETLWRNILDMIIRFGRNCMHI